MRRVRSASSLARTFPKPLRYLDLGGRTRCSEPTSRSGGRELARTHTRFGGSSEKGSRPTARNRGAAHPGIRVPIDEYVEAITEELAHYFPKEPRPTLILEPGRYLVCDAIVFVTRNIRIRVTLIANKRHRV